MSLHRRGLRDLRECRQILTDLRLTHPYAIDEMHAAVERAMGAPIKILRVPRPAHLGLKGVLGPSTSGLWLAYRDHHKIVIFGEQGELGEAATRMHEYGHMLFGDETAVVPVDQEQADLFPDLDPDLIATALQRCHHDTALERRAETFATLGLSNTTLLVASAPPAAGDNALLASLKDTLERP